MNKIVAIVLFLTVLLLSGSFCRCASADEARQIRTIQGNVSSVDWVGSVIVINDIRLIVLPDTKIYKGNITIPFSDIRVNDAITVTYYRDSSGTFRAISIAVYYGGDFPV